MTKFSGDELAGLISGAIRQEIMGVRVRAEILAGGQYAEGRLYYFFLKPEYAPTGVADANP